MSYFFLLHLTRYIYGCKKPNIRESEHNTSHEAFTETHGTVNISGDMMTYFDHETASQPAAPPCLHVGNTW